MMDLQSTVFMIFKKINHASIFEARKKYMFIE